MSAVYVGADLDAGSRLLAELIGKDDPFWDLVDLVDRTDLSAFERGYRADGQGGRPYDPRLMVVAVLWCVGNGDRSPSRMAWCARNTVVLRAWFGRSAPGLSTFRRFMINHARAWREFFRAVLAECDRVGLVDPSVTATDGTVLGSPGSLEGQVPLSLLRHRVRVAAEELEALSADNARRVEALGSDAGVDEFVEAVCDVSRLAEARARTRLGRLVAAERVRLDRAEREGGFDAERTRLEEWLGRQEETLAKMVADQEAKVARHARGENRRGSAPVAPEDHCHVRGQLERVERTKKNFVTSIVTGRVLGSW